MGSTQPRLQWVPWRLIGIKRRGRGTEQAPHLAPRLRCRAVRVLMRVMGRPLLLHGVEEFKIVITLYALTISLCTEAGIM
jgi:hypothetical protein